MDKKKKLLPKNLRHIIKYRSLQMVLFLFYAEDLKKFIIGSMRATDMLNGVEEKKKLDKYLDMLVADGVISEVEKAEFVGLIDYRNEIAHEVQVMNADLDLDALAYVGEDFKASYQYGAVFRIKYLSKKIREGMQQRYVMEASFRSLMFEATERVLEHESKLLFKKIVKAELAVMYGSEKKKP